MSDAGKKKRVTPAPRGKMEWIDYGRRLLTALSTGMVTVSLLLDDVIEYRLRWLWQRILGGAVHAIARLFARRLSSADARS